MQGGVSAPPDALVWGQFSRALAFEENNAFAECVAVVMAGCGGVVMKEEEEENGGGGGE